MGKTEETARQNAEQDQNTQKNSLEKVVGSFAKCFRSAVAGLLLAGSVYAFQMDSVISNMDKIGSVKSPRKAISYCSEFTGSLGTPANFSTTNCIIGRGMSPGLGYSLSMNIKIADSARIDNDLSISKEAFLQMLNKYFMAHTVTIAGHYENSTHDLISASDSTTRVGRAYLNSFGASGTINHDFPSLKGDGVEYILSYGLGAQATRHIITTSFDSNPEKDFTGYYTSASLIGTINWDRIRKKDGRGIGIEFVYKAPSFYSETSWGTKQREGEKYEIRFKIIL